MIKSLLDEEEPRDEKESRKSRLLKKRLRRKEELISISLTDDSDPEELPGESKEEIKEGILGLSGPSETEGEQPKPPAESEGFVALEPSGETGRAAELEGMLKELEEELLREREGLEESASRDSSRAGHRTAPIRTGASPADLPTIPGSVQALSNPETDTRPESQVEIYRRTGLAWSAAIALFGSVVFMLAIGWVADVLLGSSPWGIVIGVVIGALIGFLQFFRITSEILKPGSSDFEKLSLRSSEDEPSARDEAMAEGPEANGP